MFVSCPHCRTQLDTKALQAGTVARCGKCHQQFQVPHPQITSLQTTQEVTIQFTGKSLKRNRYQKKSPLPMVVVSMVGFCFLLVCIYLAINLPTRNNSTSANPSFLAWKSESYDRFGKAVRGKITPAEAIQLQYELATTVEANVPNWSASERAEYQNHLTTQIEILLEAVRTKDTVAYPKCLATQRLTKGAVAWVRQKIPDYDGKYSGFINIY